MSWHDAGRTTLTRPEVDKSTRERRRHEGWAVLGGGLKKCLSGTQTSEGGASLGTRFFLSTTTVTATDIAPIHIPYNMTLALHHARSGFEDTPTNDSICTSIITARRLRHAIFLSDYIVHQRRPGSNLLCTLHTPALAKRISFLWFSL